MKKADHIYLIRELERLDVAMLKGESDFSRYVDQVHPSNKKNAINLLHYLALRCSDIRELQDHLHSFGLSSLASSESHIRGQLLAILERLGRRIKIPPTVFTYHSSKLSLRNKAAGLLGKRENDAIPFIMVTLDTALADDYAAVKGLVQSGMNVARINCAHDNESVWFRMIQNVKRASKITGLSCRIYMDLAGPKIRTVLRGTKKMKLSEGDSVFLCDSESPDVHNPHTVGCTIPGIGEQLQAGETVLFDDGLIEARVEQVEKKIARLQILRISSKKPYIKDEKGINFPDSNLLFPALTDYDRSCLSFMVKHADIIGYSFVRSSKDINELREAMKKNKPISIVIKIETPEAVKNLPSLLLSGMADEFTGIMIARGDLAVEIGFERMSEIQEQILWICEAAHVPVIWATQVLENLNKSGIATRSEITDAAHAAHADCVMINKGAHTIKVIETLKDILHRSGGHHVKKRFTFRPLSIATRFMNK